MEILFVLVPVSVVIMLIALAAFIWSVYSDQYDDLEMEAERILLEDTPDSTSQVDPQNNTKEEMA